MRYRYIVWSTKSSIRGIIFWFLWKNTFKYQDNFTKQRHDVDELFDFFHSEINSLGVEKIYLKHTYILESSVENQVVFEHKRIYEGSVLLA